MVFAFIGTVFVFFLANTVINLLVINVKDILSSDTLFKVSALEISIGSLVFAFNHLPIEIYLGLGLLALILGGVMYYKLRTNFKDLETTGSKGTSRFTTLKELQAQYRTDSRKEEVI